MREQSRRKLLPGTAAPTGAAPTAGHAQRLAAEPRASARGGKARKRGKLSPRHTPRRHSPRRSEPVCGHARAAAGAAEEEAGAGGAGEPTGARRGAVSHHGRAGRPGSWYKSAAGTPSPRACLRRPPFLVAFLTAASARPPSPPLLPPSLRPLGAAMRSSRQRGDRSAVAGGGCGARRWALPRCGALCLLLALGCLLTATDGECGAGARTAGVLPPLPAIASSLSPLSVVFVGFFFFCVCVRLVWLGCAFSFVRGGLGLRGEEGKRAGPPGSACHHHSPPRGTASTGGQSTHGALRVGPSPRPARPSPPRSGSAGSAAVPPLLREVWRCLAVREGLRAGLRGAQLRDGPPCRRGCQTTLQLRLGGIQRRWRGSFGPAVTTMGDLHLAARLSLTALKPSRSGPSQVAQKVVVAGVDVVTSAAMELER